ncbi:Alpha/beta hydrolase domain-containing protein 4 [Elsinoe fawcettii]|nr:Alpha/beta hydrolase domain-containing protein 4 [Elsinoe fawcettii]
MESRNDSVATTDGHVTHSHGHVSTPVKGSRKRIIICCDGTWQSATSLDPKQGCPSNVARISRVLARAGLDRQGHQWEQLVYYDAGVGTGDISGMEKKRQGGLGIGLLENVIEAYNFIVNNYSKGDELFFFGFSRGAYTVRSAAGLACELGIIKPSAMRDFLAMYNTYIKAGDFEHTFPETDTWKRLVKEQGEKQVYTTKAGHVKIKVIGVFDTVGALGVPDMGHYVRFNLLKMWPFRVLPNRKTYEFHNVKLNEHIEHAYHALALDEQRSTFSPTLWEHSTDLDENELCQCWFPGAHINVGGGSNDNADSDKPEGDGEQMAAISYAWMLDRIMPHLALDKSALENQKDDIVCPRYKKAEKATKHQQGWWDWFGGLASSAKDGLRNSRGAQSAANAIDATIGTVNDSHTWMYDLMGFPQARQPGEKQGHGKFTVERIHPSVFERQKALKSKNADYTPIGLQGWERVWEENGLDKDHPKKKGYMWVKYESSNNQKVLNEKGGFVIERWLWESEFTKLPEGPKGEEQSMEKWLQGARKKALEGIHQAV